MRLEVDHPGEGSSWVLDRELCLHFTNTVEWRGSEKPDERLNGYSDLARWGREQGLLSEGEAEDLLAVAQGSLERAAEVLGQAIALREAIYRIFSAAHAGRSSAAEDLALLNSFCARAVADSRIRATAEGFARSFSIGEGCLERPLYPVAISALDLLFHGDLTRVKPCSDRTCGWLFYDKSRNKSRCWCAMESCGNRAKARRHYQRVRGQAGQASAGGAAPEA